MANPDVIKYELGLAVVGLIVFWVWQTVSLKRDMRKTALEEEQRRISAEADVDADTATDTTSENAPRPVPPAL